MGFWRKIRRSFFGKRARQELAELWLESKIFPKIIARRPADGEEIVRLIRELLTEL